GVAVLVGLTAEGELVGAGPGQLGEQLVEGLGVADLVLGEGAEGDVLLEQRRDAGPLRVPEAEHELVVGHAQQQLGEGGGDGLVEAEVGRAGGCHYRHRSTSCPASPWSSSPTRSRASASLR